MTSLRGSRTARPCTLVALTILVCSCGPRFGIKSETTTVDKVLSSDRSDTVSSDWTYAVGLQASRVGDGAKVELQARRSKTCTTTEHRRVQHAKITRNTWKNNNAWWFHGLAVGGVALLVGALASGNALVAEAGPGEQKSGWSAWTTTGKLVFVGGLTSAAFVPLTVVNDIKAIDKSKDLGTTAEDVVVSSNECQKAPATNSPIEVTGGGGRSVYSGSTDAAGKVSFTIGFGELLGAASDYRVKIGGQDATVTGNESLHALRQAALREKEAQRAAKEAQRAAKEYQEEADSGSCTNANYQIMQQVLAGTNSYFNALQQPDELWTIEGFKIFAANSKGTTSTFSHPLGGEFHVIVTGFQPVSVFGVDSSGHVVTLKSPYEAIPRQFSGGRTASVMFQLNAGDTMKLEVTGLGCALLAIYRKM